MIERLKRHGLALFPLILLTALGLAVWLWPPYTADVTPLVKPPVAGPGVAAPTTIVSVAQGEPVGSEAYFKGFRLNPGWSLAPTGDYGRYTLLADVTNETDSPDVASVLVRIRVADRYTELLMCNVTVNPGETKALVCADTAQAQFTSRWSRITISTF